MDLVVRLFCQVVFLLVRVNNEISTVLSVYNGSISTTVNTAG